MFSKNQIIQNGVVMSYDLQPTPHQLWNVPFGQKVIYWVVMRAVRTGQLA